MLAAALQAEVAAYIEQFVDQRDEDGRRLVVRNGYHQAREVLTAAGAVQVKAPRVNDRPVDPDTGERRRFSSAILPAWVRKSPQISEVLPLLYLHGLSTSDFGPALQHFLGSGAGLSATTITWLTAQWQDEARTFAARDLSNTDYVYLWVDGIHLKVRLDQEKLCLLVMLGVRADGRKELVAITDGYRESTESWADLLRDCRPPPHDRTRARDRRWRPGLLESRAGGVPGNQGAAVLVPQAGQCPCRTAQISAPHRDRSHEGHLQRRRHRQGPSRGQSLRRRLRRQVPQGRRQDHRRPRHAVGVLPLPRRALDPPTHHQPNRKYLRHSAFAHESHQGPGITHRRSCNGLQAHRRRTGSLAGRQRPPPGRTSPRRRRISQRQTARTPHRHHPTKAALRRRPESWNGGRLKHPNPQILTIPRESHI